jgi:hypothetical protein
MTFLNVPVQNVIKCRGQLCSRISTRPSQVPLMFSKTVKNQFLSREALLAKKAEPPETKPIVGIGTETSETARRA